MQNTQNNSHKIAIKSSETNRIKNVPFFFVFKTAYNFHVQQRKYIAVDRFIGANSPKCRIAFSYSHLFFLSHHSSGVYWMVLWEVFSIVTPTIWKMYWWLGWIASNAAIFRCELRFLGADEGESSLFREMCTWDFRKAFLLTAPSEA